MIDKLEFLLALARERSFRRAAEACGVAQPSLSAGIKQLEETLGATLVRRSSHYQGLTPEGERALDWARRMVGDSRAMREEIRALRRGLSGEIRLAAIPSAVPWLPTLTAPFQTLHPNVRVTILSRSSNEIVDMLGELSAEAGLTYLGGEGIGRLRAAPLFVERYRLLTASDGPMGDRDAVAWSELGAVPLCLLSPDMQNRRIIDRLLGEAGVPAGPRIVESDAVMALVAHARRGALAAIVSEQVAETVADGVRLRAIPLVRPDATFAVGLVVPEREPAEPRVGALLAVARTIGIA